MGKLIKRWWALSILILAFILFFYFDLERFFSFEQLKFHRATLLTWTHTHYFFTVGIFMLIYIIVVAVSFPGATFLTLIAGFLFGILAGMVYVLVSATVGAICIFLAVRLALEPFILRKSPRWIMKLRRGFQGNAAHYLITLRLIPLFPFWIVNIAAALFGVSLSTFSWATFLGIIPGSLVYVLLGNGLGRILDRNETPNLSIIFEPQILLAFLLLALLAFLSSFYKVVRKK
ncbi:MAG: TVP38/TMEM64 family protein [Gammaproteobacteria bacterium]|nr:TVP38/TMEM64 family protein [Gammaproteobacteria bacterium]